MKKQLTQTLIGLALSLASLPAASLTLIPASGSISGLPSAVIGWGFTLENDTTSYLLVTSIVESGFDPLTGLFQDYIVSVNPTILAPNSTLTQNFDFATQQGLGQFSILAGATVGAVTGSTFNVTYDLVVNDPNGPLGSDPLDQYALEFNVDGIVSVDDPGAAVPEPSSFALGAVGLYLVSRLRQRRR